MKKLGVSEVANTSLRTPPFVWGERRGGDNHSCRIFQISSTSHTAQPSHFRFSRKQRVLLLSLAFFGASPPLEARVASRCSERGTCPPRVRIRTDGLKDKIPWRILQCLPFPLQPWNLLRSRQGDRIARKLEPQTRPLTPKPEPNP